VSFCPSHKEALELSDEMSPEDFVHWALVTFAYKCDCSGNCDGDRRLIAEMATRIFKNEIVNKVVWCQLCKDTGVDPTDRTGLTKLCGCQARGNPNTR
jgi:hypothetical protein